LWAWNDAHVALGSRFKDRLAILIVNFGDRTFPSKDRLASRNRKPNLPSVLLLLPLSELHFLVLHRLLEISLKQPEIRDKFTLL
jgi:hypothetical protein